MYVEPMLTRSGDNVQKVFLNIFKRRVDKPRVIDSDSGLEFNNIFAISTTQPRVRVLGMWRAGIVTWVV